jgi:hypothetical protein
MDNELLRKTMEECWNQIATFEIVKTKSLDKNEEYHSTKKRLFSTLD